MSNVEHSKQLNEFVIPLEVLKKQLKINDESLNEALKSLNIPSSSKFLKKRVSECLLKFLYMTKKTNTEELPLSLYINPLQSDMEEIKDLEEAIKMKREKKKKASLSQNIKKDTLLEKDTLKISNATQKRKERIKEYYNEYVKTCEQKDLKPISFTIYSLLPITPIEHDITPHIEKYLIGKKTNRFNLNINLFELKSSRYAKALHTLGYKVYYIDTNSKNNIPCKLDINCSFQKNFSYMGKSQKFNNIYFYAALEKEKLFRGKNINFTPIQDQKILSFYTNKNYSLSAKLKKGIPTLDDLCKEFKVSAKVIRHRALELGFTEFRKVNEQIPWKDEEIKILQENKDLLVTKIPYILKKNGFFRTAIDITIKLKEMEEITQDINS